MFGPGTDDPDRDVTIMLLRRQPLSCRRLAVLLVLTLVGSTVTAAGVEYRLTDPALEVVPIDSSPRESFLSMRADAAGLSLIHI